MDTILDYGSPCIVSRNSVKSHSLKNTVHFRYVRSLEQSVERKKRPNDNEKQDRVLRYCLSDFILTTLKTNKGENKIDCPQLLVRVAREEAAIICGYSQ